MEGVPVGDGVGYCVGLVGGAAVGTGVGESHCGGCKTTRAHAGTRSGYKSAQQRIL
jgi:hypothetical protein